MSEGQTPAGWYHAEGDPPGSYRQWDGTRWVGEPVFPEPAGQPGAGQFQPPMGAPAGGGGAPFGATPHLVEPGSRIGGRLIDALVWIVVGIITSWPIISDTFSEAMDAAQEGRDPEEVEISLGLALVTSLINIVLIVGYEVFMNTRFGGTFGKRAVSARIVKEDGSDLDTTTALMRMVPYLAVQVLGLLLLLAGSGGGFLQLLVFFLVGLAGLIMLFTDERRQTPWDKVAKTLVVVR